MRYPNQTIDDYIGALLKTQSFQFVTRWNELAARLEAQGKKLKYQETDGSHTTMLRYLGLVPTLGQPEEILFRPNVHTFYTMRDIFATFHDCTEFFKGDIGYEAFSRASSEEERQRLMKKKEANEAEAIVQYPNFFPYPINEQIFKILNAYNTKADQAAESAWSLDKLATLIHPWVEDFPEDYLSDPKGYANKALKNIAEHDYLATTFFEQMPSYMQPDDIKDRLAKRNNHLNDLAIHDLVSLTAFIKACFRAETSLRYQNRGKPQSHAEHIWSTGQILATMGMLVKMPEGYDPLVAAQMTLISGLGSMALGNRSYEELVDQDPSSTFRREDEAFRAICALLPDTHYQKAMHLFYEAIQNKSPTARVVRAAKKAESILYTIGNNIKINWPKQGTYGNTEFYNCPELNDIWRGIKRAQKRHYEENGQEYKPEYDDFSNNGRPHILRVPDILTLAGYGENPR